MNEKLSSHYDNDYEEKYAGVKGESSINGEPIGLARKQSGYFICYNFIWKEKVSIYAKAIYCYLCRRADTKGVSFPSQKRIAEECGCSVRSVGNAIKELKEIGVLEAYARKRPNGGKTTNYYLIVDKYEYFKENE